MAQMAANELSRQMDVLEIGMHVPYYRIS